ncbi:MAG TPA: hypothetical protein VGX25_16455 [Actinophytocola sp.]|nr:hypothetical protein [Actinophytocola sp.]HEV2780977.1 hypothetical protein [Actinophytocola sp.]
MDLLGHRPLLPDATGHTTGNPTMCDRRPADKSRMAKLCGTDRAINTTKETIMSKRARKRRDRKKSGANHGKRPHS